jgi:hypothetical protein
MTYLAPVFTFMLRAFTWPCYHRGSGSSYREETGPWEPCSRWKKWLDKVRYPRTDCHRDLSVTNCVRKFASLCFFTDCHTVDALLLGWNGFILPCNGDFCLCFCRWGPFLTDFAGPALHAGDFCGHDGCEGSGMKNSVEC